MRKNCIALFIVLLSIFSISSCGKSISVDVAPNEIKKICDMSVLECYYHNTAEIISAKGKKQWIDYESTIKLGIDGSKVKMDITDSVVNITLPKIKVGEPKINQESIKILSDQTGFLKTKYTNDERFLAISKASEDVVVSIQDDSQLIQNAEARVKRIIESYINQISELTGKSYTIHWETLDES